MSHSSPWLLSCTPAPCLCSGGQDYCSCAGPRDGSWWLCTDSLYHSGMMRTAAGYQVCVGKHTGGAGCCKQITKTMQPRVMPHLFPPFCLCETGSQSPEQQSRPQLHACQSLGARAWSREGTAQQGGAQADLSHYHPKSPLWLCFISCNRAVNEVMAACGNTRPLSKGCCHLSQCRSLHSACWSPSSVHHPSCAWRSRDLLWQPCLWQRRHEDGTLLSTHWQGGSGPTDRCSQAQGFDT